MSQAEIKITVTFAEQAMRNARAGSELPSKFMVSSAFRLWKSGEQGDRVLSGGFATLRRGAEGRPHFLRSRQKKYRRGPESENGARQPREPEKDQQITARRLD